MRTGPKETKFLPDKIDDILDKIGKYIPYKKACLANGVSEKSFYLWIAKGEKDIFEQLDTEHAKFVMKLNNIEAHRIAYNIARLQDSENGHKGAQWVLERVFWKYFSPKVGEIELNDRLENLEQKNGESYASEETKNNNKKGHESGEKVLSKKK